MRTIPHEAAKFLYSTSKMFGGSLFLDMVHAQAAATEEITASTEELTALSQHLLDMAK